MANTKIWTAYFLGFGLTLLYKWGKYVYTGKKQGKSVKSSTLEWLFDPSLANFSSWTATIGGVWVLGSIYINRIISISGLTNLPLDTGIAFFLGTLFEFIVPEIVKFVVSRFTPKE